MQPEFLEKWRQQKITSLVSPGRLPPPPTKPRTKIAGVTGAEILPLVRHRYSTVKRLDLTPASRFSQHYSSAAASASPPAESGADSLTTTVLVEVQFAGPQPSAGCGALLCLLLGGDSVEARPVELPRGRKRKNAPGKQEHLLLAFCPFFCKEWSK